MMDALGEFLAMGGYGVYVWTSYAAVAAVLLLNWLIPHLRERALLRGGHDDDAGDTP